ncbi:MAG: helix-turn-helix domain-containing protein [Desulfobacterales bacterium]|nr:helix-turn-helix domain-containing protein [Desulfobacterales bacterium]MCP4161681.1 helix-turn-helix domain-containing protein [Deltaproteobacteria bacterium]
MFSKKIKISSGISDFDHYLGGLFIGDNVIWYDDAGSLASIFCMNLIETSSLHNKHLIYVSFDRSPKNLLNFLGPYAENQNLTILDCFTMGKGDGSEVFNRFYEKDGAQWPYQVIKVKEPKDPEKVMEAIYGIHKTKEGDVRFIFESLTGMQDLWGGEDHILKFYSHSCPRLYELQTIAYWVVEKGAHSNTLKAHINQIAQVAIELSINRGKSSLTILKAEGRTINSLNKPRTFYNKGIDVEFREDNKKSTGNIDIGLRLKEMRVKKGFTQTELAKMVGVTPSNISQVEGNLIYPSLSALLKIAETLSVNIKYFFEGVSDEKSKLVFSQVDSLDVSFSDFPKDSIRGTQLTPAHLDLKAEPYIIEILPGKKLSSHFFKHKGEEVGYMLSGKLNITAENSVYTARTGDLIYLSTSMPSQWKNPGPDEAKVLWIKMK